MLLCLHGWGDSSEVFRRVAPLLSRDFRLVLVDWRGHGAAGAPREPFWTADLVEDAVDLLAADGASTVIPIAASHAGWMAIELRRRLGPRVAGLVLLDWMLLGAPPPFVGGLREMMVPERTGAVRDALFRMWLNGEDTPEVTRHLREVMAASPLVNWRTAAREILASYEKWGSPIAALEALEPKIPTLHLTPQRDALAPEQSFAREHPWFQVEPLSSKTHFPALECPEEVSSAILRFVRSLRAPAVKSATAGETGV